MPPENGKSVTFKWLVGVLVTVVLSLILLGVNHTVGAIDKVDRKAEYLEKSKLDKLDYQRDQGRLDKKLEKMDEKLDRLLAK